MTHPNPPPVSRAHVIAELYNLLGLFASLQTSRVQLAHQYEAHPDHAGPQSAAHHRGSATPSRMDPDPNRQPNPPPTHCP